MSSNSPYQMAYFGIIGLRKILFAFNLVILNNFPKLNLVIFMTINLLAIGYLVKIKPMKSKVHLIRDVITELSFLTIFGASFSLLDEGVSVDM